VCVHVRACARTWPIIIYGRRENDNGKIFVVDIGRAPTNDN